MDIFPGNDKQEGTEWFLTAGLGLAAAAPDN